MFETVAKSCVPLCVKLQESQTLAFPSSRIAVTVAKSTMTSDVERQESQTLALPSPRMYVTVVKSKVPYSVKIQESQILASPLRYMSVTVAESNSQICIISINMHTYVYTNTIGNADVDAHMLTLCTCTTGKPWRHRNTTYVCPDSHLP